MATSADSGTQVTHRQHEVDEGDGLVELVAVERHDNKVQRDRDDCQDQVIHHDASSHFTSQVVVRGSVW